MSQLFSPITIRSLTLRNRAVISPMCQYTAQMGLANDWHLVQLGRYAIGGFGLAIVEATGVEPKGRISYACVGLWSDAQIAPLARIVDFLHANGTAAGIQLAHAGRKGSAPNPLLFGATETAEMKARLSYEDWTPVAPSAIPHAAGWKIPHELTIKEINALVRSFAEAAIRADRAGFDVIEIHGAHGYLIDEFLSPLANKRTDAYGGVRENRMRFPLEVIEAIRAVWPDHKPLFMRLSVQDWNADGWQIEDSIALAKEAKARGVDVIDCSSGGFAEGDPKPAALYQVPFAEAVKNGADIATMAIGLIGDPEQAEQVLTNGQADLIAVARPALEDPNWAVHAHRQLDPDSNFYALYPHEIGNVIRIMDRVLNKG